MTEGDRVALRLLAWYDVNVTEDTLVAFEAWQREKKIFPMRSTVLIDVLPDGRRHYRAAFDQSESYRIVWWFGERKITVTRDTSPLESG